MTYIRYCVLAWPGLPGEDKPHLGKPLTSGSLPLVAEPHSATPCVHITINPPKLPTSLSSS